MNVGYAKAAHAAFAPNAEHPNAEHSDYRLFPICKAHLTNIAHSIKNAICS